MKKVLRVLAVLFVMLNLLAAVHAYKFTHFYPKQEVKILQPEQMGVFDKFKLLVLGVDYAKKENLELPSRPFEDLSFSTQEGLTIKGWKVKVPASKGTVLMFHGHGSNRSGMLAESESFNRLGYNTVLLDFRAHGNSDGQLCTIGFEEKEEVKLCYDLVKQQEKGPVVLWGISMGAATITNAMQAYPEIQPDKVILEMPFGSLSDAVKGRVRMIGLPEQPLSGLLTFWGGTEQGFWAFSYQPSAYAASIHCPVLQQWGALDKRVSKQETEAVYEGLGSDKKKLVIYPQLGHQSLYKGDSLTWNREVSRFLEN